MQKKVDYSYYDWRNRELVIGRNRFSMNFRVFFVLRWMDGKTTNLKIRRKFKEKFDFELSERDFKKILKKIKDYGLLIEEKNGCLVSKLNPDFVNRQIKLFLRRRIRPAQYAGVCYSDNREELDRNIQKCFNLIDPVSFKMKTQGAGHPKGVIVPHSNLDLSGPCAAWAYKAIEETALPELFVILAPDHSRSLKTPFSISSQNYGMLDKVVKVDDELINSLKKDIDFNIFDNNVAHLMEHAVEMQLPFLLHIFKKNMEKLKIIPIICASEPRGDVRLKHSFRASQEKFFKALKESLAKSGRNVIFIATGDLAHAKTKVATSRFHKENKEIINLLRKRNAENLKLKLLAYRTCGRWPFYSFLRLMEPTKSRVLNYSWASKYHNRDKAYRNFMNIGYVSMVFY